MPTGSDARWPSSWLQAKRMSPCGSLSLFDQVPKWVVADRGLSSHAFREHIWNLGAVPATRYEKTAQSFMGVLCLAAALDWLKT